MKKNKALALKEKNALMLNEKLRKLSKKTWVLLLRIKPLLTAYMCM